MRHALIAGKLTEPESWVRAGDSILRKLGEGFLVALLGTRGGGKTQLAVEIIRHSCWRERSCRYVKTLDLFLELRGTYAERNNSEESVLTRFSKVDLLVLDEAGVRGETDFENRMLTHLIDTRYDAKKDTLLISNQRPEEFAKSIGPSISDRLRECGGIIECTWASFRGA